jgi:hypothetical protein
VANMPSLLHPEAKFDPIPPDLDLSALVEKTPNFDYVVRIAADQIHELGLEQFEKLVLLHVIVGGKPLVVEGWNRSLPPWLFSQTWLVDNVGKKREYIPPFFCSLDLLIIAEEKVRDIVSGVDMPMTIGHYLGAMEKLTRQWTPANYRDSKRQRLYLKDIDCPEPWHQHLQNAIPQTLFYLNDCVGEQGGPGALHQRNKYNQLVLGKGVGPAGDLMSNLPIEMRAENMMCYIGHEGTYTPAHREMCASLGQNIMVETSATENGEKAGSSIWFMTESKDREVVSEYFLSMLGHDIEVESHFAQINAWKKAPFPVYIVNQKVGDLILIPPLAPHQVWNRGTRTMKVAWNRTTVETLELALHEALPRARMVCRDEQYKNKAIVYYSLLWYYDQLKRVEQAEDASWDGQVKDSIRNSVQVRQLKKDFKRLFALYTEILVSEMFSKDLPKEKHVEFLPFDSNVTCSYCRCNIFNRFLTCKTCVGEVEDTGDEDTYDICMECYAMGRSCGCVSSLTWVEQWQWPVLTRKYEEWRAMVIANDGIVEYTSPPQSLDVARSLYGKKPVAQVCQEQLKRRPWRDISKPFEPELSPESEPEPEVDDEGRVKKKKGSRRKSQKTQNKACHICQHREWSWKLAFCTTCPNSYCYGTLWRAFDLKPQAVMEDPNWQCPKCLKICSCGKCRRDPTQQAYRPKGTLLGHDTRCVADPRSVESLVDFSRTNLTWLRDEGDNDPQTSLRMQRLMEKAQTEKAREESLEEDVPVEGVAGQKDPQNSPDVDTTNDMAIDPQLRDHESNTISALNDPDSSNLGNDSTMTLAFISHRNGQHNTTSDSVHQVMANGGNAQQEPHQEKVSTSLNSHAHYVAPEATMFVPESSYPDPSAPGRDRMMGMGYYQQANDADKILFDHPDASTPTGQESAFTYPRLPEEPPNVDFGSNKRTMDSRSMSNKGEMDDAHAQFFQAQKKQKLGRGHTAKLPLTGSKEFLLNLQELDEGQARPGHNPRRPSRSMVERRRLSGLDDGAVIVTTDVQGKVGQSIYHDDSDDEDDSTVLATRAIQKLTVPPPVSKAAADHKLEGSGKRHGHPPKVLSETDRESSNDEDPSYIPCAVPSPTQKPRRDRPSSPSAQKKVEDRQQASPPSSGNTKKGRQSPTSEIPANPEVLSIKLTELATTSKQAIVVQDKSAKEPSPVSKNNAVDEDINMIPEDYTPVPTAPATTKKPSRLSRNKSLSEDYLKAKEEAFRMVEAELEEEEAAREHSQKFTPIKAHVSPPTKAGSTLMKNKVPTSVTKSVPKRPPGQLMSMAERQALKGKPFKIVAAKSTPTHGPASTPTTTSSSKPKSTKMPPTARFNFSSDDSAGDGSSSDSDDNSIPAVRPVAKKPRIEALAAHNGNTKANFEPVSGMLDGVRKGQPSVRLVK